MKVKIVVEGKDVELTTDVNRLVFENEKEMEDTIKSLQNTLSYDANQNELKEALCNYNAGRGINARITIPMEERLLFLNMDKDNLHYSISYNQDTRYDHYILEQKRGEDTIGYINIERNFISDVCSLLLRIDVDSKNATNHRKEYYSIQENDIFRSNAQSYLLSRGFKEVLVKQSYIKQYGEDHITIDMGNYYSIAIYSMKGGRTLFFGSLYSIIEFDNMFNILQLESPLALN